MRGDVAPPRIAGTFGVCRSVPMSTPWDAGTYDRSSEPQQAWASEVLARLADVPADATVLDVGCGTGRVTEALLALVPRGRVLAFDASADMVRLARERLGERAEVWQQDVLDLDPWSASTRSSRQRRCTGSPITTASGRAGPCAAPGRAARGPVRRRGEHRPCPRGHRDGRPRRRPRAGRLVAMGLRRPSETELRLQRAGFRARRCWLEERPTDPRDVDAFVRTSILPAHLLASPRSGASSSRRRSWHG